MRHMRICITIDNTHLIWVSNALNNMHIRTSLAILVMVACPTFCVTAILSIVRKFPFLPHRQADIYRIGILLCCTRCMAIIIGKCGNKHTILLAIVINYRK